MNAALNEKLVIYGERAYVGAWGLEIIASITGLATGVALAYRGYTGADANNFSEMDFVLASAPYFMVAIAELTKIPIATLLFYCKWIWKPAVALFLLGMAAITFETVYMGLDRALTLRKDRYDTILQQIAALKDDESRFSQRMNDTSAADTLKRAKENRNELVEESTVDHNNQKAEISDIELEIQGQRSLSPDAARVAEQITAKKADRERLMAERDKNIKDTMDEFERQRTSFDDRLKLAQQRNDLDAIKHFQAQEDALANPRQKIEAQYTPKIEAFDKDIGVLQADFAKKLAEAAPMSASDKQKLDDKRSALQAQLSASDAKWANLLSEATGQINSALQLQTNVSSEAVALDQHREQTRTQIDKLEKERISEARLDQVRRIAARFYGEKPEDVSNEKVDLVSNIWFGSLALLAALAGPLTALVSLELQSIAKREESANSSRLSRLLRKIILSWRWRRVRTVSVPIEVPVTKEVEKRVEVPVERVVKEILYVPILTEDPQAIQQMMSASLDKEIADHVSFTLARPSHGSPA